MEPKFGDMYMESDCVKSVQTYFVKKLRLPLSTLNYVVYLETEFKQLHFYTMKLHIY